MLYTTEYYEKLRRNPKYFSTNAAWNKSGVNNPKNIGYLMPKISKLSPDSFEKWEKFFLSEIANENKLRKYEKVFREYLDETYEKEDVFSYVVCRLIYETYIGWYREEKTVKDFLDFMIERGYHVKARVLNGKDDNRYAVDRIISINGKDIFAIQVKSETYMESTRDVLMETKRKNKEKNKRFEERFCIPVFYLVYDKKEKIVGMEHLYEDIVEKTAI